MPTSNARNDAESSSDRTRPRGSSGSSSSSTSRPATCDASEPPSSAAHGSRQAAAAAGYMALALSEARKSPPKPSNFRVGAVLVDEGGDGAVLATGYTLELPGNTHAEQCALAKYAARKGVAEHEVGPRLPVGAALYTTVEPCAVRLSGNTPCVQRILETRCHRGAGGERGEGETGPGGIARVYVGVAEPETFVGENNGRALLAERGIECVHVEGFEEEILRVATAGHHAN